MSEFDKIFAAYRDISGKTDSCYAFVFNDAPRDRALEYLTQQLKKVESISDSFKRKFYSERYFCVKDHIANNVKEDEMINEIFMVNENMNRIGMLPEWKALLQKYKCPPIACQYGNHYPIEWLQDYLTNDDPYQIISVFNNKFSHYWLTLTKKRTIHSCEDKSLTVKEFVADRLEKQRYILYGVSGKLKGYTDPNAYCIVSRNMNDDEILDSLGRIENDLKIARLKEDLRYMDQEKTFHRVKFKKEISKALNDGLLQKLYLTPDRYQKFKEGCEKNGLDITCQIILVDTGIKSFQEGDELIINKYDGVVGVTYY